MTFREYTTVSLKENNSFSDLFRQKLLQDNEESRNFRLSYAVKLAVQGKPIPEDIANKIKKTSFESSIFAYNVKIHGKDVGEDYLKQFVSDTGKSKWYAELLADKGEPIPEYLLNSISKNPESSFRFAKHLIQPYVKRGSSISSGTKNEYSSIVRKKGLPIPEPIIQSVSHDPFLSYALLRDMIIAKNKELPVKLVQSIKQEKNMIPDLIQLLKSKNMPVPDILKKEKTKKKKNN